MGERLLCKQEVDGSIPFTSTSSGTRLCPPRSGFLVGEFGLAPPCLEALRVSRKGKGPRLLRGRSNASRFFYQSEEFGAPFTLFVFIRCLSLWIGLLDEGFDLGPVAVDVRSKRCVRRRRPVPRFSSGLDEHVCLFACGVCPCA